MSEVSAVIAEYLLDNRDMPDRVLWTMVGARFRHATEAEFVRGAKIAVELLAGHVAELEFRVEQVKARKGGSK